MIKISVLMSVYNTNVNYLTESIESILNQTYRDFEFIIVNDGSQKPYIQKVLEKYGRKDSRIVILENKENLGLTKSLNRGLRIARGEYIARMDSDDISVSDRFERQIDYLEKHKEVSVLGSRVKKIGEKQTGENRYYIDYTQGCYERFRIKMFFRNVGPVHPSIMIRRAFLEKYGISYKETIRKAQDYSFYMDCIMNGGKIYNYPEILLYYRLHRNQITVKDNSEQNEYAKTVVIDSLRKVGFEMEEQEYELFFSLHSDRLENSVENYVAVLHKLKKQNRQKKIFEEALFERELKLHWLHKAIKCVCRSRDCSAFFNRFTYECLFSSALIDWVKNHILKIA